jgi:hypothetical protein
MNSEQLERRIVIQGHGGKRVKYRLRRVGTLRLIFL